MLVDSVACSVNLTITRNNFARQFDVEPIQRFDSVGKLMFDATPHAKEVVVH
jgi:hypothetical protein